jgi:hypothetical protein
MRFLIIAVREMFFFILPPISPPSPLFFGEMGPMWVPCYKSKNVRKMGERDRKMHCSISLAAKRFSVVVAAVALIVPFGKLCL